MVPTKISGPHWDLLLDRIAKRQCVPFLGAGVNAKRQGYRGLPLGGDVAHDLVVSLTKLEPARIKRLRVRPPKELKDYPELISVAVRDLGRVAFRVERAKDRPGLVDELKQIIDDTAVKPSPLLRALARLPFDVVVTSNYDRLLEQALDGAKARFEPVVQPTDGFHPDDRAELDIKLANLEDTLILYKLHGSFGGGESGALAVDPVIVTDEDYIKFLTVVGDKERGIPLQVREKMVYSSLLFLGYGLQDWDFRTLFKALIEDLPPHEHRKSFALQRDPPDYWVEFWRSKGIEIYNVDLQDFAQELESNCKEKGLLCDGAR